MNVDDNVIAAITVMAAEYRRTFQLRDGYPVEVVLPHWLADAAIKHYGSLERAANMIFNPGSVVLVDTYWRDFCERVQDSVNARLQSRA